jgi:hypothetical protein
MGNIIPLQRLSRSRSGRDKRWRLNLFLLMSLGLISPFGPREARLKGGKFCSTRGTKFSHLKCELL